MGMCLSVLKHAFDSSAPVGNRLDIVHHERTSTAEILRFCIRHALAYRLDTQSMTGQANQAKEFACSVHVFHLGFVLSVSLSARDRYKLVDDASAVFAVAESRDCPFGVSHICDQTLIYSPNRSSSESWLSGPEIGRSKM